MSNNRREENGNFFCSIKGRSKYNGKRVGSCDYISTKFDQQKQQQLERFKSIDIKALAKEHINNMRKQRTENLKELGYDGSLPLEKFFLLKKDIDELFQKGVIEDIYDLIGSKGKIRYGFVGFTYRLIDKKTEFFQTGLSFVPHPNRLNYYLRDCIFYPKKYLFRRTGENQIYGWIAEAIDEAIGLQTFRDNIAERKTSSLTDALSDFLEFEITGVFWDEKLVRLSEDEQIAVSLLGTGRKGLRKLVSSLGLGYDIVNPASLNMKKIIEIQRRYGIYKNMKGMGLNDPTASGLSGNPRKVEEFLWYCGYYTALGLPHSQIHEKLRQRGLYSKGVQAFKAEYDMWFGSISQARKLFLDPIRKVLLEKYGYSEGDVNRLYPLGKEFNKELFINLLEENFYIDDIAKMMGWSKAHLTRLGNDLIVQEYDFIKQYKSTQNKDQTTVEDLQFYLIGQKILRLIMDNSPRSEILESFEGGMPVDKFRSVQRRVLRAYSYNDLQNLAREVLLNMLILDINPSKVSEIYEDPRCSLHKDTVFRYLKQFYINNPLVKRVLSKQHLPNLEIARIAVVGTELEKFYKLGFSDRLIKTKLNNKYTLEEIKSITKLIWNLDPNSVRLLLQHTFFLKKK